MPPVHRSPTHTRKTADQFVKFCLVGVLNTGIHYGVFLALFRYFRIHYLLILRSGLLLRDCKQLCVEQGVDVPSEGEGQR